MIDETPLPPRLSRAAASAYLLRVHGISRAPGTLAHLASAGAGPAFRKIGYRTALYDVVDLDRWASSILQRPATPTGKAA